MKQGRNQGGRCQCASCGAWFTGMQPFDWHRAGDFKMRGHTRRCLAADEMRARGMMQTESGAWNTGRPYGATGERIA